MKKILVSCALAVFLLLIEGSGALTSEAQASSNVFNSAKDIITRSGWGADSKYLYQDTNNTTPQLIKEDSDFTETYSNEIKIKKTIKTDSSGKTYKWPLEYPEKVTKFIIHHTDTTKDLNNPKQAIRNIYYYHAVSRGWGDIGYNYIIDPSGKVYEGRQGGEGVVGGHAGPGNIGSIGISVLGDYENNDVPQEVINSLARLIAIKAQIEGIDPTGSGIFRGKMLVNVMGHMDIMSTDCPGKYLYAKLPLIASMAKSMMSENKTKFTKDYDYIDKSNVYYLELKPDEVKNVTIKFQNIGKITWDEKTYLMVNRSTDKMDAIDFPNLLGIKLAKIKNAPVKPGDVAEFSSFQISSQNKDDTVYVELAPVINGKKKIGDYKTIPVKVIGPTYTYDVAVFKDLPPTMKPGDSFISTIKLKNTGNVSWTNLTLKWREVSLGKLVESKVDPDQTATFNVTFKAPSVAGFYSENIKVLTSDGKEVFGDGLTYTVVAGTNSYAAELTKTSGANNFEQGKSFIPWIKIRNIGLKTWQTLDFSLDTIKDDSLEIKGTTYSKTEVKPGEEVEIDIKISVKANAPISSNKTFSLMPKINGISLLPNSVAIKYNISKTQNAFIESQQSNAKIYGSDPSKIVQNKDMSQGDGGYIRVKLGFNEAPSITSSKSFVLYDLNGKKIKSFKAKTLLILNYDGKSYTADSGGSSGLVSQTSPFKVKADDNGVLQIKNWDRKSAWDASFNDNKFLGSLEFRVIDGAKVTINELLLEDYLKGLAEEPNSAPIEKIKAIIVAARSYAKFYMHYADKFSGKPYHLDDDPAHSQKYLGFGYGDRAPNLIKAVDATKGEVLTYNNQLIKAPYFSSDDGKTKSAYDVWKWSAPYLISVDDPYCKGKTFAGHGVGMSGCGSFGMAQNSKTYQEILKYYYTGVEITKMW